MSDSGYSLDLLIDASRAVEKLREAGEYAQAVAAGRAEDDAATTYVRIAASALHDVGERFIELSQHAMREAVR